MATVTACILYLYVRGGVTIHIHIHIQTLLHTRELLSVRPWKRGDGLYRARKPISRKWQLDLR